MRQFMFTASLLTGLILSACAQEAQGELEATKPSAQDIRKADTQRAANLGSQNELTELPEQHQNLDPRDITPAEFDELMALQKKAQEHARNFPVFQTHPADISASVIEDSRRLRELHAKSIMTQNRKRYQAHVPSILTQDEVDELLTLEQAQENHKLEMHKKYLVWFQQDPASRGQPPNTNALPQGVQNLRLQELKARIRNSDKAQQQIDIMKNASKEHNISISDSELNELTRLQAEQVKLSQVLSKAVNEFRSQTQASGGKPSLAGFTTSLPKYELQRFIDVRARIEAIKAPIESAQRAARIKNKLTALSQQSGITILSSEIEETIALSAEKARIEKKAQRENMEKFLDGSGALGSQPFPNDKDYARLKEIDARIKDLAAPMRAVKNVAQETLYPPLQKARLARENRAKWIADWRDKQQSGEVPRDAIMHSPSYAEIQDRVKDYSAKLKTRADKVGYSVSAADAVRLNSLNEDLLVIRKDVHAMEADGSAMVPSGTGKTPSFKFTAGMTKIGLIENKQREILAGLSEAERSQIQNSGQNSETGTRQFNRTQYGSGAGAQYGQQDIGTERQIESFRNRGLDVSQADADDLLAFERELENR